MSTHGDTEETMVPAPRRCHGSVQYTDEKSGVTSVVISGGYNGDWVFSDVWRLDLGTLQWTRLRECFLPCPVYFHSAALTPEGRMYIFGGIVKMNNKVIVLNSTYATNVSFNVFSSIVNGRNFIITGAENKRSSFRLANNSQIVRDLLASFELLLSKFEK